MSSTPTEELFETLRRSARRWKTLALTLLTAFTLVIVLVTATALVLMQRERQRAEASEQEVKEALREAESMLQENENWKEQLRLAQQALALDQPVTHPPQDSKGK
jgi:hypothetical protein